MSSRNCASPRRPRLGRNRRARPSERFPEDAALTTDRCEMPRDFDPPDEDKDRTDSSRAASAPISRDFQMSASVTNANGEYCRPAILDQILGGGHKVIDASAGTGKTFTIERSSSNFCCTGAAQIDQILVVTFTEKATAELRARIRATIEDVMSGKSAETRVHRSCGASATTSANGSKPRCFRFIIRPSTRFTASAIECSPSSPSTAACALDLISPAAVTSSTRRLRAELRERLKSDARVERLVAEWLVGREAHFGHTRRSAVAGALAALPANRGTRNQPAGVDRFDECVRCERAGRCASYRGAITDDARTDAIAATRELETIVNRADRLDRITGRGLRDFDLDRICEPANARRVQSEKRPWFPDQMPDRVRAIIDAARQRAGGAGHRAARG